MIAFLIVIIIICWMIVGLCSTIFMIAEDTDVTDEDLPFLIFGTLFGFVGLVWVFLTIADRRPYKDVPPTVLFKKRNIQIKKKETQ